MNTLKYASILDFNTDEMVIRDDCRNIALLPLLTMQVVRNYSDLLIAVDAMLNLAELCEPEDAKHDLPLMVGDKILFRDDNVIGVRFCPKDPRRMLQAKSPAADYGNPWDRMLIELATHHPALKKAAVEAQCDLNQLREIGTSWEWSSSFPDETGKVAGSIPGFKQLNLGATVFVPFFSNGTTPESIKSLLRGEGRYAIDRGGAWATCDKAGDQENWMWTARLWDKQMDEEVPRSRVCSWDMESTLSVVALFAKEFEEC